MGGFRIDMAHEGWSNQETWQVALTINNDQGFYRRKLSLLSRDGKREAMAVDFKREFEKDIIAEIKKYDAGFNSKKVNWAEITADFKANYKYEV
jgi:nuclear transport factor 2 (NTF2) superfamily protein